MCYALLVCLWGWKKLNKGLGLILHATDNSYTFMDALSVRNKKSHYMHTLFEHSK